MLRALICIVFLFGLVGCALDRSARNVFTYKGKPVVVGISETTQGTSLRETYSVTFNGVEVASATPAVIQSGKRKPTDPIITSMSGKYEGGSVLAKRLLTIGLAGVDIRYEIYINGQLMTVVDVL